jgi:hypothetical protein
MCDWLRDHLDPKRRQLGGRADVLESLGAPIEPALAEVPARGGGAAGDGG